MQAYLDNSATTRCSERAKDLMVKVLMEDYGNPSSLHTMGVVAERYIKEAKERIAKTLKADEKEILFTSGGTESNNMALIGTALANKRAGNHIITTSIEHASVLSPLAYLEEQGFRVTYLTVDENGQISLDELRDAVYEDTILVSMMMVNNEIGAVEPIAEAAKIVKEKNPNTIIHVDAIQAYGKYRICPKKLGIDLLSVSGHKIHAPKGTGFLYIKDKTKIKPIIYGGGQQKGMRSGTENVPGAAALGDIGKHFPDTDSKYKGISSILLLEHVTKLLREHHYEIGNIDATIIAQKPKMAPHIPQMRANMAKAMGINESQLNIKATTEEKLGFTGREEGIASQAICLLNERKES